MIQNVITSRVTRWVLLQRLLGVITDWKLCSREHGGILVVTERSENILSETKSTGTMVEFKKPRRRPEKGNTEWPSLSPSLLSHGLHVRSSPSAISILTTSSTSFFQGHPIHKRFNLVWYSPCI